MENSEPVAEDFHGKRFEVIGLADVVMHGLFLVGSKARSCWEVVGVSCGLGFLFMLVYGYLFDGVKTGRGGGARDGRLGRQSKRDLQVAGGVRVPSV